MSLREILSDYWYAFQQELFPSLESELGPMGERYELFVTVLELVCKIWPHLTAVLNLSDRNSDFI